MTIRPIGDPGDESSDAISADRQTEPTVDASRTQPDLISLRTTQRTGPRWFTPARLATGALTTGGGGVLLGLVAWVISTPIAPGQGTVLGGIGVLAAGGITYFGTHRTRLSNERIAAATKKQAEAELTHEREKLTTTNKRDDSKARRTETREQERALRARFIASAAQLADDSPTIRLAGVFSLASLANDWFDFGNVDEKNVCIELLRAYIVSPQTSPLPDSDDAPPFLQVRARIARVLHREQILRSRIERRGLGDGSRSLLAFARLENVDLSGADLSGANLTRANLTGANLTGANLTGAGLTRANLTDANLTGTDMSRCTLAYADLTGANLTRGALSQADLTAADLTSAELVSANLTGASLNIANLTDANLSFANLTDAYLFSANLAGVIFFFANLTGADLTIANLTGTDFRDARGIESE